MTTVPSLLMTTDDVEQFCHQLAGEEFITIDTEFMRRRSYWPELCLMQIAGREKSALIDPLAAGMDLAPLWGFLRHSSAIKVFHAAWQDLEIIHHLGGFIPAPLFDTQIAAMVCGFGESIGYENLVRELLGVSLDKSAQLLDWRQRPLSEKQKSYAHNDVIYLRQIYTILQNTLKEKGRQGWIEDEMAQLADIRNFCHDDDRAWFRLKFKKRGSRSIAERAKAIAAWREKTARERNLARRFVLPDEAVLTFAQSGSLSVKQCHKILRRFEVRTDCVPPEVIFQLWQEGASLDQKDLAKISRKSSLPAPAEVNTDLLRILLKHQARLHGVAPSLIAQSRDLTIYLQPEHPERSSLRFLHGWRYDIFGQWAEKLCEGQIALGFDREHSDLQIVE